MAKKTITPKDNKAILELSEAEAAQFDTEITKRIEEEKAPKPVKIKALNRNLFRKGPYAVVDRNRNIFEFKTRREAYDKALELNARKGFSTMFVEEIF